MNHRQSWWLLGGALWALAASGCVSSQAIQAGKQNRYGIYCARNDAWKEAEFRWQRALELDPGNVKALNNLAIASLQRHDWEAAEDYLARAAKADPHNKTVAKNQKRLQEYLQEKQKPAERIPEDDELIVPGPEFPPNN